VKILNTLLADASFDLIGEGYKNMWNPDEKARSEADKFGKLIAEASKI
jgi:hypothetical protein